MFLPINSKFIAYVRVSSKQQINSLYLQKNIIEQFLYSDQIIDVVEEIGSAWKDSQPKLNKLITETKNDIIICEVDRFSRNIERGLEWMNTMHKKNLKIISVQTLFEDLCKDPLSSTNPIFLQKIQSANDESIVKSRRMLQFYRFKKIH